MPQTNGGERKMNNEFIPFADIGSAIDYYYDKPVAFAKIFCI